jgi:RNase P subunit RPR2
MRTRPYHGTCVTCKQPSSECNKCQFKAGHWSMPDMSRVKTKLDPNKAFRDRKRTIFAQAVNPEVEITLKNDRNLKLTCNNCGITLSLHLQAGMTLKPAFVTCSECGDKDWEVDL